MDLQHAYLCALQHGRDELDLLRARCSDVQVQGSCQIGDQGLGVTRPVEADAVKTINPRKQ